MIGKLGGLLKSPDAKRITHNFLSLAVLRGFDVAVPLITLPYLVKTLGIDKFGHINFALSLAYFFSAVMQYGFGVTATREIARSRHDATRLSEIYSATFWSSLLLALPCAIAFIILVVSIDRFNSHLTLYLFTFLFISLQTLFPLWFFQGMEQMKYIAYLSLCAKTLFLLALFLWIRREADYYMVPLLNAGSAFVSISVAFVLIRKRFQIKLKRPSAIHIANTLKQGRDAFISQLAPNLYNNSTTFVIGIFTNNSTVGHYTAATKILDVLISIGHLVSNTCLPYLSRSRENHRVLAKFMLGLGLFLTAVTLVIADPLVEWLFGPQNLIIATYLKVLAVCILMVFAILTYSTNYLMIAGKDSVARNISLYVSLAFFLVGLLLISVFGVWGGIATLIGARTAMALLSYYFYRKDNTG